MPLRDPDRSRRRRAHPSSTQASTRAGRLRRARALRLDPATGSGLDLTHEVGLLRAAIRRLARDEEVATHVKTLAELHHQVDTLCTTLRTQHDLDGSDEDTVSAVLARTLEELGDELGVPR